MHPDDAVAVMHEANLDPQEPYKKATSKWRCICMVCHAEVTPTYHAVKSSNARCPKCAAREAGLKGRVPAEKAIKVMQDTGYEPLTDYTTSDTPWPCRCTTCGQESTPTYGNAKAGFRCIHCGRKRTEAARRHDAEEMAEFMHSRGFEPLEPYPGSGKRWRARCLTCQNESTPSHASVRKGTGCKFCKRRVIDPGNAMDVMREAGLEPHDTYPKTVLTPWPSTCTTCRRDVEPTFRRVLDTGRGCRYCTAEAAAAARRKDPEAAAQFMRDNGFDPLVPYPGSSAKWACRCLTCDRDVLPTLSGVGQGNGCALCARDRIAASLRLDPAGPVAKMRAAGLEPLVDYPGSGQPWLCRCMTCGEETSPRYNSVVNSGQGACAHCAGKVVTPRRAEQVIRAAGFEPLTKYTGSKDPWPCRCTVCDRNVEIKYSEIKAGHGCSLCYEDRRGETLKLDPMEAEAAMVAAGLVPQIDYPGAGEIWPSLCTTCLQGVGPNYSSVRAGGGCRYCAAKERGVESRREEASAVEIMELAGLQPLGPYVSANEPWECRCRTCGKTVKPKFSKVRRGGGCRYCSTTGFDFASPGKVYVMIHRGYDSVKVGIAAVTPKNVHTDRIRQHQRHGWELYKSRSFVLGGDAHRVEQGVLRRFRAMGFGRHLTADLMPQGGASETFDRDLLGELTIWDAVCEEAEIVRQAQLGL